MTLKDLFDKTEAMNELLKVVEKRFVVMVDFNDGNCFEFPTFEIFKSFMHNEYFDCFTNALLNATFEWDKPIVNVPLAYIWLGFIQEAMVSITLCEHDIK